MLAPFIKYLEEHKLVEFEILGDSDVCFQNRFKIQKYVFLAKRFGMDLPFEHDMYLYGPYSRSLISKCYELANNRKELYDTIQPAIPISFKEHDFLDLIYNKNDDWLDIATTLIDRNENITKRDTLVENVKDTKNGVTQKFISKVLDDLKNTCLIRFVQ